MISKLFVGLGFSVLAAALFSAPVGAASGSVAAAQKPAKNAQAAKPAKSVKPKTAKPRNSAKFVNATGENKSERDRRLLRECKGRPNSGACEGYTR